MIESIISLNLTFCVKPVDLEFKKMFININYTFSVPFSPKIKTYLIDRIKTI